MLMDAPVAEQASGADLVDAIRNRPTSWQDYAGAVLRDDFNNTSPGIALREIRLPQDDLMVDPTQAPHRGPPIMIRTDVPVMSEEEWKRSPSYRPTIPYDNRMTAARAQYKAEIHDEDQYLAALRQNRATGVSTALIALGGGLVTQAADPVNYLPIFGPAFKAAGATRFARLLFRAGSSALDAATATALVAPANMQSRQSFGDDVSAADALTQIGVSAAFGGLFGGGLHGAMDWRTSLASTRPDLAAASLHNLAEAANQFINGKPITVGPEAYQTALHVAEREGFSIDPEAAIDAPPHLGAALDEPLPDEMPAAGLASAPDHSTGFLGSQSAGTPDAASSAAVASPDSMNLSRRPVGIQTFFSRSHHVTEAPPSAVGEYLSNAPSQERMPKKDDAIGGISAQKIYHEINDVDQLMQKAAALAPHLTDWLQYTTDGIPGASVYGARAKETAAIASKIAIGRAPNEISDYLGGRIVADNPQAIRAVIEAIDAHAAVTEVDDFLEKGKGQGYRAVHLQVKTRDGLSYELQIQPREIRAVQDEAHILYQKWRRRDRRLMTSAQHDEADADFARARGLFAKAWDDWSRRTAAEAAETAEAAAAAKAGGRSPDMAPTKFTRMAFDPADPLGSTERFINAARNPQEQFLWLEYGPLGDAVVQRVADQAGVNIAGYRQILDAQAFRKIIGRHGQSTLEMRRGQLPIGIEDFARLPEIVTNAQVIASTTLKSGREGIEFVQRLPDGTTFLVQETRSKRRALAPKTMFKWAPGSEPTRIAAKIDAALAKRDTAAAKRRDGEVAAGHTGAGKSLVPGNPRSGLNPTAGPAATESLGLHAALRKLAELPPDYITRHWDLLPTPLATASSALILGRDGRDRTDAARNQDAVLWLLPRAADQAGPVP